CVAHDRRSPRPLGAEPYQRRVSRDPVRSQSRRIPQGLNKIRLAVAVRTDEHRPPWRQFKLHIRPGPEVPQAQMTDVHLIANQADEPALASTRTRSEPPGTARCRWAA